MVTREELTAKILALRYVFMELGVEDGMIVCRTDCLGVGPNKASPGFQRARQYR